MPRTATHRFETMGDVLEQLGGIDPRRVRVQPAPGRATERDLVRLIRQGGRLCELVDGVLVEKDMGLVESFLAMHLGRLLGNFVEEHDLGFLAGADGALRLMPGLVRIPDVSFISWDRVPVRGEVPDEPVASLAPDLAVEVLSEGNTPAEMRRKLKDYFFSGARLVWFVDPRARTVEVFTAPDQSVTLAEGQALTSNDLFPGLSLPLRDVFARVPREPRKRTPRSGKRSPRRGRKQDGSTT
jgi:Uma2 family endonuclease